MQIRKLDASRPKDIRQFVVLPFRLYRDCPQWTPPLRGEAKASLNRDSYPFYRHSQADFFIAESGQETLGRIAAIHNRRYSDYTGSKTAFFYFFDAVDDLAVSRALFDAAFQWAREQGLEQIIGPKGMLRADSMGLLVEGAEQRAGLSNPYNYAYYERLVTDAGFEKEVDYLSGHLRRDELEPERIFQIAARVKARRGFSIRSFGSKDEMRRAVPDIGKIYNEAFEDVWNFYPVDDDELQLIANRLIAVADPRLIKLVVKGEEVAGFLFAFPDISAALQRSHGRLWPLGWWHLLREQKRTRWVNLNGIGLLPQYQGVGANAVLYAEMTRTLLDFGFTHGDFTQIAETNIKSLGDPSAIGVHWNRRHRIYRRKL